LIIHHYTDARLIAQGRRNRLWYNACSNGESLRALQFAFARRGCFFRHAMRYWFSKSPSNDIFSGAAMVEIAKIKKESAEQKRKRAQKILASLNKEYPDAWPELNYSTPFELLVATVLSAQCTDARVNIVTKDLFKKYRTPKDFLKISQEQLEQKIRSTGFYRNKAKSIRGASKVLTEKFDSHVPRTMEELLELPGVARKTANIVLSHAYDVIEGIAVDTHVKRLSQRLGFTSNTDPDKIEADLCSLFPKKEWRTIANVLIFHGRRVCEAKKPNHAECVLYDLCPSRNI
jgi:endonuclease-3